MAQFQGIIFNGVKNPDYLKVASIEHSMLSGITNNYIQIPGRHGAIDVNAPNLGIRYINVNVFVLSEETNTLPQKLEELAKWLFHKEPKRLILGDNLNRVYYARLEGDTTFTELLTKGEATLTFACPSPFSYNAQETTITYPNLDELVYANIMNKGSAPTPPRISFTLNHDLTNFSVNLNDSFVEFGRSLTVDEDHTTYDPLVFYDACRSLNGWTKSSSIYGGVVTDQAIQIDGNESFEPSGGLVDETENKKWYGPAMQKQITKSPKNFEFRANMNFTRASDEEKTGYGKNVVVLKDQDNTDLFLFRLFDNSGDNMIGLEAALVKQGVETKWLSTGYKFDKSLSKVFGTVKVSRRDDRWNVSFSTNINGSTRTVIDVSYFDSEKQFSNNLPKWVQFGFQRFEKKPVNYMFVSHFELESFDAPPTSDKEKPTIIAKAGDKIEIDYSKGEIFKSNAYWLANLRLASTFTNLEPGINTFSIEPSESIKDIELKFVERYY
ncbi:MAG: distal tail protein Dit [Clostridium sp.]|uniref:distal tail protein Dit n=1 Tax=Clostridium sp. TaxID=1506 RepID=UPI003F406D0D